MVFRESDNRIRLLEHGDYVHPDRHQKLHPSPAEVPEAYRELLDWAKRRNGQLPETQPPAWLDGLHRLKGLGKEIWSGVDPDAYVRNLREGWE